MKIKPQPKDAMAVVDTPADTLAAQGARRATEDASVSAPPPIHPGTDSEVVPRPRRRSFSNADKRRILGAADRCSKPGEVGALLRREGVYSSALSTWRRQREAGELATLAPRQRGPKVDLVRADAQLIARLTRERDALQKKLDKAQLVIDVQKKVSALLGLLTTDSQHESN